MVKKKRRRPQDKTERCGHCIVDGQFRFECILDEGHEGKHRGAWGGNVKEWE